MSREGLSKPKQTLDPMRKKQITWLKRGLALSALLLLTAVNVPHVVIFNSETVTPSFIPSFVIEGQARTVGWCSASSYCCFGISVECSGETLCSARSGSVTCDGETEECGVCT